MTGLLTPGDVFDATDIGDDTGRTYITLEDELTEDGLARYVVVFNEPTRWHMDRDDRMTPMLQGTIATGTLDRLAKCVETELHDAHKVRAWDAPDVTDPEANAVEFSMELDLPTTATLDELIDAAWPFIATCINVTDPGTFNSPYVMECALSV